MASASPALVHDYLLVMRGAERTFGAIADCFPGAPVYTLLFDREAVGDRFAGRRINVSRLQRLGVGQRGFRMMLPLFAPAVERLPLDCHDLVISSSSAFAHGVRVRDDAVHVCYCHTPFRYAWHERDRAVQELPPPLRPILECQLARAREWDRAAARRVTRYVANSRAAQERIARFWGREAPIVHPPVEVERFWIDEPEDYFLVVTELVRHKRVEIALEAARRSAQPIKVVGTGPEFGALVERYGAHAEFLGRVDDTLLARLYARARAVVVPGVEEFGIVAVEAQAAGRPVVAAAAGGALETVADGETGVLVRPGDVEHLAEAMGHADFDRFRPENLRAHALRFSPEAFRARFMSEVELARTG